MSDSDEEVWEHFADRKSTDWTDLQPVPQDDGPNPVCSIAYTDQFTETMNYFRAVLQRDERSPRALHLTTEVIKLNAANYTAWYFRRLVLDALKADLAKELSFVSKIGRGNPKNYQIWFHRREIVTRSQDFSQELQYTADQLEDDNKNYHAWAHRQWVVQEKGWWDQELPFIEQLLSEDLRNNSAWNQRYFVVTRNKTQPLVSPLLDTETAFAWQWIKKLPNNQSPWNYLKGLFSGSNYPLQLKEECLEFRTKNVTSPHAASLLVDILEQEGTSQSAHQAVELCKELESSLDNVHRKYWLYRRTQLEGKLV